MGPKKHSSFAIKPVEGRTLNAILADAVFSGWPLGGMLALVTIFSEDALLIVGAQAGFVDGPRVMANIAVDSWLPRRFAAISERLTMQNGILLMGSSAILLLLYTRGSVSRMVVMYAINVFITFSLSQLGMAKFFFQSRQKDRNWKRHILVHMLGLVLCLIILAITVFEKFEQGGLAHASHHIRGDRPLLCHPWALQESRRKHPSAPGHCHDSSARGPGRC